MAGGYQPDPADAQAMVASMHHRGPDDAATYADPRATLGATRLAIIDLEGGNQPISNEDESAWIVFNGELYNFANLRETLLRRGHRFRTASDTEVVLHSYEEFGDECVQYFNGMFAFAIWDRRRARLLLARDRVGIKPLYYAQLDESLVFASELRTCLRHPAVRPRLDLASLSEYLTFEYVPTPRTIISGVKKLPPGHTLALERGSIRLERYWDPNLRASETGRTNEDEYVDLIRRSLAEAVRTELVSDVPVGVFLSGGIDSSAVAAMAVRASSTRVQSFSVGFHERTFDESPYARMAAEHLGTDHHELMLGSQELLDLVPRLADVLDEPNGDSSFIPTYFLSKFVRGYVKVALAGDGGDELFAGYPTHQAHRLVEYYERLVPGPIRREVINPAISRLPTSFDNISFDFRAKRFISGRGVPIGVRHHLWLGSFGPAERQQLLEPWAQLREHDTFGIVHQHLQACSAAAQLNQLLYLDMKMYLEGDILAKVDRASMACSLEVRVPLLNHRVVQSVTTIPQDLKLRGLTPKHIFRKAMRGILPEPIVKRPKKG
ncbi:MAG: asparagine synthase (glutamine-hydrolyzing), partial [Chloroflexi bacterium]|nr:asparagine synthase (glutamine-hydrolyzing) [Chloroflexota bacterium]